MGHAAAPHDSRLTWSEPRRRSHSFARSWPSRTHGGSRLDSKQRPHFSPTERMRVLALRTARGWSLAEAAARLQVNEQTLRDWMRRVVEGGERALIRLDGPANRFPDLVRQLVRQLKRVVPTMGKVRIAQVLARAGLQLGPTTVRRILRERGTDPDNADAAADVPAYEARSVHARRPDDIWHVDLTTVPTRAGFWVPWSPHALPQRWPFCWWVAVVLDQFSRTVVGFAVFRKQPTAAEMRGVLRRACQRAGRSPRHLITDRGEQFTAQAFRRWCRRRGIRQRFGAVQKSGSIAVIERFFRSLKSEATRQVIVPLDLAAMREEIALYVVCYNRYRPHRGLEGRTPEEARMGMGLNGPAGAGGSDEVVGLDVRFLEGRQHLPIVALRRAA